MYVPYVSCLSTNIFFAVLKGFPWVVYEILRRPKSPAYSITNERLICHVCMHVRACVRARVCLCVCVCVCVCVSSVIRYNTLSAIHHGTPQVSFGQGLAVWPSTEKFSVTSEQARFT